MSYTNKDTMNFDKELQQALRNTKVTPSPQTWSRIEASLVKPAQLSSALLTAARWVGAAAAAVLIAVGANLFFAAPNAATLEFTTPRLSEFVEMKNAPIEHEAVVIAAAAPRMVASSATTPNVKEEVREIKDVKEINEPSTPPAAPATKYEEPQSKNYTREVAARTIEPSSLRSSSAITISLMHASGTPSQSMAAAASRQALYELAPSPTGYSSLMSKANYAPQEAHHHAPISYGLSIAAGIGNRWSISSGISYSALISELTMPFSAEKLVQRVQFIGVPIAAQYHIYNRSNFSLYAGAGAQIERCIAATLNSTKIEEKPWHSSVELHAGAQYNINQWLALYAEPEVNYYLTPTQLITSRTDSPVNFNLRVGIRFMIK